MHQAELEKAGNASKEELEHDEEDEELRKPEGQLATFWQVC
jgi:hypothetical protein